MGEKIKRILKYFTIGNFFKLICVAIAVTVIGTLAFRIFTLNHYPASSKGVIATSSLSKSYEVGTLSGVTWDLPAEYDNAGEFFVHQPLYFENEKTLLITIRYNDSLLDDLKHEGSGETLALFPSVYADGVERILPMTYEYSYAYGIYSYRRYVFENVELSNYEHMYLDIHLEESYEEAPYTTLEIYNTKERIKEYKLSGADEKDLRKFLRDMKEFSQITTQ
ncbi:MAG: hypothetical protein IJN48_00035 [Clostridia bacterium]|nr:hypothetical protein [Clostridia bacterium]